MDSRNLIPEQCRSIFVPWKWLVGILIAMITGIAIVGYNYGSQMSTITTKVNEHDNAIGRHENALNGLTRLFNDLDTIKAWQKDHP
jgi:hypothetical protein